MVLKGDDDGHHDSSCYGGGPTPLVLSWDVLRDP